MRTLAPDGTDQVWVGEEHEAGAAVNHLVYGGLLDVRHVAQDGEDHHGREEGGEGVDAADDNGVLVAVVVELVVASEGQKGADSDSVREEDLSAAV